MMDQAIKDFAKQFDYEPEIVNEARHVRKEKAIICGMGGSHIAGDIIKDIDPSSRITVHRSYGLPQWSKEQLNQSMVITSSYSGNTEEVLDAYATAQQAGLPVSAIAVGGALIEQASSDKIPHVQMPDTDIQPRCALGFSYLGTLKLLGREDLLEQAKSLVTALQPEVLKKHGKQLADKLRDHVPVLYASARNYSVVWNWKIKFNETGKIPAFFNLYPELNHNEMTGFDVQPQVERLSAVFYVLQFRDINDHPRVQKRMDVTKQLYEARGIPVMDIELSGSSRAERIFSSLLLGDWTAYYTSQGYGLESEQVPMVEEFKQMITK